MSDEYDDLLDKPNVPYADGYKPFKIDVDIMRGFMCNPVYTGMGPFPQTVADPVWVEGALTFIENEGAEQFLVNLLYVLRQTFDDHPADLRTPIEIQEE